MRRVLHLHRVAGHDADPRAAGRRDRREADDVVLDDRRPARPRRRSRRRRGSTYFAPSMSACQVGAMNSPSCSIVGLRKTGAVSRMKSIQNWPGTSGSARRRTEAHQALLEALGLQRPGEGFLDDEHDPMAARAQHLPDADAVVRRAVGALGKEDDRARVGHVAPPSVAEAPMMPTRRSGRSAALQAERLRHPADRQRARLAEDDPVGGVAPASSRSPGQPSSAASSAASVSSLREVAARRRRADPGRTRRAPGRSAARCRSGRGRGMSAGSRLAAVSDTMTRSPRAIDAPRQLDVRRSRSDRPARPPARGAATRRPRSRPSDRSAAERGQLVRVGQQVPEQASWSCPRWSRCRRTS